MKIYGLNHRNKQEIIDALYPVKFVFNGFNYRTARLNEAVELIYNPGAGFSENENGQTEPNFDLSTLVPRTGTKLCHKRQYQ
jgi:hypothetical protein